MKKSMSQWYEADFLHANHGVLKVLPKESIMRLIFTLLCVLAAFQPIDCFASDKMRDALDAAYSDELVAYTRYKSAINQFGSIRPFSNLLKAEERHLAILGQQYRQWGWTVPIGEVLPLRTFSHIQNACDVSLAEEKKNVALYDRLLPEVTDISLREAFLYLRYASSERHIPALQRCGGWRT